MERKLRSIALGLCLLASVGCAAHTHTIGAGGGSGQATSTRQWYALWGAVPLNTTDAGKMAGGASDYTIHTELSVLDWFISIITGFVSVGCRTVTVIK